MKKVAGNLGDAYGTNLREQFTGIGGFTGQNPAFIPMPIPEAAGALDDLPGLATHLPETGE